MFTLPPFLENRVRVLVALSPFPAGAITAVAVKKATLWSLGLDTLRPGDTEIGLGLAVIAVLVLVPLSVRSARVWLGAPSRFTLAFKLVPVTATLGAVLGLAANAGR